jgi:DNA-binding transcriptional LysR family regulator
MQLLINWSGVTILPKSCARKELGENRIVELTWRHPLKTSVLMVRHRESRISNTLHFFMNRVRKHFKVSGSD